jgi:hypothetical protein
VKRLGYLDLLSELFRKMPATKAQTMLFGILEKVFYSWALAEQSYLKFCNSSFMTALSLSRSPSSRIGFLKIVRIAADAQASLEYGDHIALSAIVRRMFCIGDQSLHTFGICISARIDWPCEGC